LREREKERRGERETQGDGGERQRREDTREKRQREDMEA